MLSIFFSAWIEESQIKPYEAFKEQFSKAAKTTLKEAIDAIEDYINNKGEVIKFVFVIKIENSSRENKPKSLDSPNFQIHFFSLISATKNFIYKKPLCDTVSYWLFIILILLKKLLNF